MQQQHEKIVVNQIIVGNAVFTVYMEQTGVLPGFSPVPVHTEPQRTQRAVVKAARKQSTNGVTRTHWSDEDDKRLVGLLTSGVRPAEAAAIMHRTNAAVWSRASMLRSRGVAIPVFSNNPNGPHGRVGTPQQA